MNHLFSIALLLLIFPPQDQKLPDAFHKLPEEVREKATLILTGTYSPGRGPCLWMADGSRRWALQSWFRIRTVYRGEVRLKSIHLGSRISTKPEDPDVKLELEREYLVLLRPSEETMKAIKAGGYVPALDDDEVLAIVELK